MCPESEVTNLEEYLQVGKIVNTHGVKGELKVIPLTDNPERFNDLGWIYIKRSENMEILHLEKVRHTKNLVIVKFREINDMSSAEALKGFFMLVDRKNAVKLPKDSYFICDLIGCRVVDENGNYLGTLANVLKTGSNDVYVVKDDNGKEILIPALKSVVRSVSLKNKTIKVVLPEGLVDDEI